ncbi:MAG: hypothetical protein ACREEN_10235, partial [Stellaceae bacterium]
MAEAAARPVSGRPHLRYEGWVAMAGLAVAWQITSLFFPHFLFPSLVDVARHFVAIFSTRDSLTDVIETSARILDG